MSAIQIRRSDRSAHFIATQGKGHIRALCAACSRNPQAAPYLRGFTQPPTHMVPSLDFVGQKEFRRGTQAKELIDYFAKHFQKTST
jgi:hypothetical protein